MPIDIGEVAPDFTLPSANNETISLSQFRGEKYVILSFHVFNFTAGCTTIRRPCGSTIPSYRT